MIPSSMRLLLMGSCLSITALITGAAPCDEAKTPDPVQAAFEKLEKADKNWSEEDAASKTLASLGEKALWTVLEGAQDHEQDRVRRACYSLLSSTFANDDYAIQQVIRGLFDKDQAIQQQCAFRLGDLKVYKAHRDLRAILNQAKSNDMLRFTAAKSLAQLGEADVIRTLYEAVTDDAYMPRHVGNIGLKALTGKNLDDFEGYKYSEGAFVSGGKEAVLQFDAVRVAEKKAKRFQVAAAYFRWLRDERPEIYKHASGTW